MLTLLPGPLWLRVIVSIRILSKDEIIDRFWKWFVLTTWKPHYLAFDLIWLKSACTWNHLEVAGSILTAGIEQWIHSCIWSWLNELEQSTLWIKYRVLFEVLYSNLQSSLLRRSTRLNEWGTQWDSNSLV